jgi:hypothetical protein
MTAQHRSHRLTRALAAGVATAVLAAPSAVARPIDDPQLPISRDRRTTVTVEPEPGPARAPVVRSIDDGLDWGSAAIGAGAGGALVVLVSLGGYAYTSRNRIRVARS